MRWKPIRAGIYNVWEYDDQTFEFGDGRLALRGRNGSGKSNALAVLCPFLLDGVMSAARMDPMGGGRSMKSLLLGRDDDDRTGGFRHDSGTGYVWMEFGDGTAFVTIGIGAAATQHRDAESWFFVTDRRIGHDLELADNDTPFGRRQLGERLDDSELFTRTEDYRAEVDRRLFGLGPARYRRLVDLLLTLRRPHLAGKLDTEHLSATLSAGLGELDPALIDDVAHSFDDLDAMQHELEGLAASLTTVERFLPIYREHLVEVGRRRAAAVVDAHTALRTAEQARNAAEDERRDAETERSALDEQVNAATAEQQRLDAEIDTIQQSPAYQNATALAEVSSSADRAELDARGAAERAASAATNAADATAMAASAAAGVDTCSTKLDRAIDEWNDAVRSTGVHARFVAADFDDQRAIAVVSERLDQVAQVVTLATHAATAADLAQRAEEHERATRMHADAALVERDRAAQQAKAQRRDLTDERARWTSRLRAGAEPLASLAPDIPLPTPPGPWRASVATDDDLTIAEAGAADIEEFHVANDVVTTLLAATARAIDAATSAAEAQQAVIDDLYTERERVATEPNPGPPPNPTRPDAQRAERRGVPLYVCADFADHVDDDARAGIEAALGAAGLLDARVAPDRDVDAALDATLIARPTAADGPTLADVLVPVPVGGLDAARIADVLTSIPLDGDVVELHTDGRWRLGPLAGRFTQSAQQFIGHAPRERRRAERLADLDHAIARERETLHERRVRRDALDAVATELADCRAAQPSTAPLTAALVDLGTWVALADEREATHSAAAEQATERLREADSASADLHTNARRLGLPSERTALADIEATLRECDGHRRLVVASREELDRSLATHEQLAAAAVRHADRAEADHAVATRAEEHARSERRRYEQLKANVGGDAQQAIEALAAARRLRAQKRAEGDELRTRLASALSLIATLTERIAQADTRLADLAAALTATDAQFGTICSAEVADVLAVEGVEPGADPRTAARRLLAATDPVPEDATNRMEHAHRTILLDGLRAGHDPSMPKIDGVDVVRVGTVDGELPIGTLARQLRDEYERTGQLLTKQEREIFETHLLTRVGDALRQLLLDADAFEHHINEEMSKAATESGMIVELRWEADGDEPGLRAAITSLRTAPEMLGPERREELREFFMQRIADLRSSDPGRSFAETLTAALDYRSWHRFALYARFAGGSRQRVTRAFFRDLSGGEAAALLHLPLFAAAASQYSNGQIAGPRLIALDEAFVGIDEKMRARLMGLLTQLDLDVILTSHEIWGFYDTVPALVLYDLVRRPPALGVYAQRFDWTADATGPS